VNRPAIQLVAAVFRDDGTVEYMITYTHVDETLTPGSKKSATTAARMARHALEVALEALDTWAVVWDGFAQARVEATDRVLSERKPERAA